MVKTCESGFNKDNKLKVFTAFSGYDSQCMALDELKEDTDFDYDLVGWSEIDKNAIIAHNALFPQWKDRNYGDISKINWEEVPDFDLFTYSSPCFVAGTLVLTEKRGYVKIEDITPNDKVLTHMNNWKNVISTMNKEYCGELYTINSMCSEKIQCTSNHPFYVRKRYRKYNPETKRMDRYFTEPKKMLACELTKDTYLGVSINTKSEIPIWNGTTDNRYGHNKHVNQLSKLFNNNNFWYLMGRYIGDGWKKECNNKPTGIVISCSKRNYNTLIDCINQLNFHYSVSDTNKSSHKVTICMKELFFFVERFGYYAHDKFIDNETMNLPINLLKNLINGIIDSDGHYDEKTKKYRISSVSKKLINSIGQCVMKVYHTPYKVYYQNRGNTWKIEDRIVNQKPIYELVFKIEKNKQDKAFYDNGYIWCPIRKIIHEHTKTVVYNMSVEDDESYTVDNICVFNCTDFSRAGFQKGGDEDSGTRSSLLWECRKAILAKKPKYLLFENVKDLVSNKFIHVFNKWCKELESYGYNNFWQVLNAKDYGIPQSRERVFMISIKKDENDPNPYYEFPEKIELEKTIDDFYEDNVDEKYYYDKERVDVYVKHLQEDYPFDEGQDTEHNEQLF